MEAAAIHHARRRSGGRDVPCIPEFEDVDAHVPSLWGTEARVGAEGFADGAWAAVRCPQSLDHSEGQGSLKPLPPPPPLHTPPLQSVCTPPSEDYCRLGP